MVLGLWWLSSIIYFNYHRYLTCTAGITGNLGGNSSKETNKTHKIGETVKNGDLEVTVNSVETMKSVGPSIAPTNAKGTFVVADVN